MRAALSPQTDALLVRWAQHAQAQQVLRRVLRSLGPNVRVMPLRGALLAATGVVHPTLRPLRDLDVLVDRLSLRALIARLARDGFALADLPTTFGVASLRHPEHGSMWVDLHVRPAPIGLGRMGRGYLFEHATEDRAAFGAAVWIPTRLRTIAHVLVTIAKDRVVRARPHLADDLAALVAASAVDPGALARELATLGLTRAGALACAWALELRNDDGVRALRDRLDPRADRLHATLARWRATDDGGVAARLRARAIADRPSLRVCAVSAALAAAATRPLRRAIAARSTRHDAQSARFPVR